MSGLDCFRMVFQYEILARGCCVIGVSALSTIGRMASKRRSNQDHGG
jgi:hypothetical protein